ncbi:potassium channel beta subunit 1 [Klebsormidium nitens]|uniref:Potassium channel beta subunit 1 n=1 Tax=Klebsormidium nitens TaxID=105231 RepID=A0A1Y1IA35_KLENI|nr:potassium channel beta subunit 1 [Klebsormidium nitens]|eukprot:GAQ85577.1 potassium channel beta subunit 1 [Klebsormidium nitens]
MCQSTVRKILEMEYRFLGNTGLKVSALGLGAWVPEAKEILQDAFNSGVNFFDNAEVYAGGKAEQVMGQAFKELDIKRSELVLTTKIFWGGEAPNEKGLCRKHVIEGTQASLKRYGVDYFDVIYAHRPDVTTPIEETVRAFNHIIDKGYAFYWGTSEWSAQQIEAAWGIAKRLGLIGPVVEQPEYNLFHRDRVEVEYEPLYEEYKLGLTTWSPLASGLLTGKYSKGHIPEGSRLSLDAYKSLRERLLTEENLEKVDKLKPIAQEIGATLAQFSLAWVLKNPHVSTVLTGASKREQFEENKEALKFLPKLTSEVIEKVEDVMKNKPTPPKNYREWKP